MVLSRQSLPCLTVVLGILGVVVCVAGLAGVLSLGSRLTETSDKVFERIDETLAAVQDRVAGVQERVRESKITADDIDQSLKKWTKKETRQRLASRLEVEKKAEQLVIGLRQADRWLEISGVSIQGIQQGLQLGSSLGAPVDVTLVDPWLERLGSLRSQLERSTETVSGIRDHAAEITAGDTREERVRQAIQLTLRVAVTLGEIDSRLGESGDRLAEMQSKVRQQRFKTHRRIMTAIIGALLLITWMGAGQVSLCLHGWRVFHQTRSTV